MTYSDEEISARLLRGEPVSFSPDQPEAERQVPAASVAAAARAGKRVQLENAIVTGPLDLSYAEVRERFELVKVRFEDAVYFSFAHFYCGISCHEVRFTRSANFEGAVFDKRADFTRAHFAEWLICHDLAVNGSTGFSGARITGKARFDGAKITGDLFFRPQDGHRAEFEGEAGFPGIEVGGVADFSGARFATHVRFDGAKITGDLFFRPQDGHRAEFDGEAGFHGVEVGGQADFSGARFAGEALFEAASFSGPAFFISASFNGAKGAKVSFAAATFSLAADFRLTHFTCPVHFDHAYFHQPVYFPGTVFGGNVSFREACFTTLSFEHEGKAAVFDPGVRVDLTGCTYSFIEIANWRDLMRRLDPPAPQPWGQLIRALRAAGEEREAREAYYAWRESEGNRIRFRDQPGRYIIDRFERWVAEYGVRSRYVLAWILLVLSLGTFIFSWPGALRTMKDYPPQFWSGLAGPFYAPALDGLAVSISVFMPVEVYVGRKWEPQHGIPSGYALFHTLMGWILIPVVVASLTGLLRREPPA